MSFKSTIPLTSVVINDKARDGTWCKMPYGKYTTKTGLVRYTHPKGCPNYPKCIETRPHFSEYPFHTWTAVVEKFDLGLHARKMKIKHPHWTDKQARNLLYWQGGVRKRLREKAEKIALPHYIILDIPEANGVDVIKTMEAHGLTIETKKPDIVHKVMLVGRIIEGDGMTRDCGAVGHGCEDCFVMCDANPMTQEEDDMKFIMEDMERNPYEPYG